jgi:hypothetical protein
MKNNTKNQHWHVPFSVIRPNTHPMVASSGFKESYHPPPLGNACGIKMVHRHNHLNDQQCTCIFNDVLLIVVLAAAGAIWSE